MNKRVKKGNPGKLEEVVPVDTLIDELHISIGSIKAGNTSEKLRIQVVSILDLLLHLHVITV